MGLTASAHEEVFAEREKAGAGTTHSVVPRVGFQFACGDGDGGHRALSIGTAPIALSASTARKAYERLKGAIFAAWNAPGAGLPAGGLRKLRVVAPGKRASSRE